MNENSTINKVRMVVDYIEENIKENLSLEDISKYTSLSKFHLHRIFKAITNKKLMEYTRSRKLSCSINKLLETDLRIIDVAYEYKFEYEQSYIRSFTKEFGISPNSLRKEKCILEITDKININQLTPIGSDGIIFIPSIKIQPEFSVIGMEHKIRFDEMHNDTANQLGTDFFYNHRHKITSAKVPLIFIAVSKFIPNVLDYMYYIPSLLVTSLDEIPNDMNGLTIPYHKYAVFKYIGFHHARETTIKSYEQIHNYIFNVWLANSDYVVDDHPLLEIIDESVTKEDYCEIELFVPIKEKSPIEDNNINIDSDIDKKRNRHPRIC